MIRLSELQVKECIENAADQHEALVALYRMVFPHWDTIERLDGYPEVNDATWKAICRMFVEFDKVHHPDVMAGGLWLNCGFSGASKKIQDWAVSLDRCTAWPAIRVSCA